MWRWAVCVTVAALLAGADGAGAGAARLLCYVSGRENTEFSECTHLVYAGNARGDQLDSLLQEYRTTNPRLKIILRINDDDKDLRKLLKSKYIQGLELHELHRTLNRTKVVEAVETAKKALSSNGGGPLFLSLPSHPELLAKYYDMRSLVKKVDLMMVQTHALGAMKKMTYHPSRLSGLWDMMNTDSVVDLVVGLGVPASKIVVSLPATVQKFTLQNETLSTPGSPAVEDNPKETDQAELCRLLQKGRWTLERDQDLSAPYAFKDTTWMSFEDASSVDVKGKYARVRGLAGLALDQADRDVVTPCGPTLRFSLAKVLNQQSRAPRAAVLRSLEQEILSAPREARAVDALQVSPYRITQVVDSDGVIHSIREDTRTEFSCTRQGYYVHPRSCGRFYRCVKFDQTSSDYTVFEFDCPAGLWFDSRVEVCVWPGSSPHSQACPGSSEIAPVPHTRFVCPNQEGYYADPENCRWFFACLDHGGAALMAYEFRCPFGLGFDAARRTCEWPWLVPACGHIARYEAEAHGYSGAVLTGATGFRGQTADAINVAAHNSLVSGASVNNLVGIQSGLLSKADSLDPNFISLQELRGNKAGDAVASQNANSGFVQATQYNKDPKYTSGSLILDDYRQPTKSAKGSNNGNNFGADLVNANGNGYSGTSFGQAGQKYVQYLSKNAGSDNSGQYVHDPSGDYAEPYSHERVPDSPYVHQDSKYNDYFDTNRYTQGQYDSKYGGRYLGDNGGRYVNDNSGAYVHRTNSESYIQNGNSGAYFGAYDNSGAYKPDNSGQYNNDNSGQYVAGIYQGDGKAAVTTQQYYDTYNNANTGKYLSDSNTYTGASHTLTNGAVNVGFVGKTTLVDAAYNDQFNYKLGDELGHNQFNDGQQVLHPGHVSFINQPSVSINHIGTASHNLDGYNFIATPTDATQYNLVPTTPTPFAVTTSLPAVTTYRTTFVPEAPRTSIKQIFGVSQPPITYVQPTVIPVTVAPRVQVTDYTQGVDVQSSHSEDKSESGYTYNKPAIKFEDGLSYTTPAPVTVSTYKPQGFGQSQQTLHQVVSDGFEYSTPVPVTEEPFRKVVAYTTGTPSGFAEPSIATYTPRPFGVQTVHELNPIQHPEYVEFSTVQPPVVSTYQPDFEQRLHQVDINHLNTYSQENSGYEYSKPTLQVQSTTPAPAANSNSQAYSTQTLHTVNTQSENGYQYNKPAVQQVIQYTTPAPELIVENNAPSYSQQTLHVKEESGYDYSKPAYSTQTLDTVNTQSENGYQYNKPAVQQVIQYTTPAPELIVENNAPSYSQQTLHVKEESGYEYSKPAIQFEPQKVAHPTPARVLAPNNAQSYSQKTLHNIQSQSYVPVTSTARVELYHQPTFSVSTTPRVELYQQPAVSVYENPILKYTQRVTPVTYAPPTYVPQSFSHQTLHKVQANQISLPSASFEYINPKYVFEQPKVQYEYTTARPTVEVSTLQPQVQFEYTTARPAINLHPVVSTVEPQYQVEYTTAKPTVAVPVISSTPQPHVFSHQTLHNVDIAKINAFAEETGYAYQEPLEKFEEAPKVIQYTTQAPVTVSTYRPQIYRQQVFHTPVVSKVEYKQPAVSYYENPILKYVENTTPKPTATVITNTVRPVQYQTVYQPEIQRDIEATNYANAFSDATLVSQQSFRLGTEDLHVAPVVSSTTAAPITFNEKFVPYQRQEFIQTQDAFDYKPVDYSQQYAIPQKVSFGTGFSSQGNLGSVHLSEFPGTKVVTKYKQVNTDNQIPEVQVGFNSEELLQPVVSTTATPFVTTTYRPITVSTSTEYLSPKTPVFSSPEYLPPETEKEYLPPLSSTTAKPIITSTTLVPDYKVESTSSREYLPPLQKVEPHVVNFESFGYKTFEESSTPLAFNPYILSKQENVAFDTKNKNLLGFGTVGPDAGLVSPVTYTTSTPYVVSSEPYVSTTQIPIEVSSVTIPVRRIKTKINRPVYYSTTEAPRYQSTTYQAPEYLPPDEEIVSTTIRPITRQQNIVIQNAKSNVLGFGTVGPDAGLVSTFSTAVPLIVSSTEPYFSTTSTFAPITEEPIEVFRPRIPPRRVKPKVAVVTKINDFNPLLVRKLGAVCSCQSPIVVLRGRRPIVQKEVEFGDYVGDYETIGRGDVNDEALSFNSEKLFSPFSTPAPIVSSSFNPIIVPDDSYYQDIEDNSSIEETVTPVVTIQSSTTPTYSTTSEKIVRIKPRVKSVTIAPTYKNVLLNEAVTPTAALIQDSSARVEAETFNRYGPGGYRGRDETLQGSVDCQRAGLFRHPKHCNKFYSCRWDETKKRFTLHVFNCPIQLTFDSNLGACNWPSQGPACQGDTLLTNTL